MNKKNLWETVLAQVQLNVSPANFATWFKNTEIVSQDDETLIVSVPNSFVKEWLENKYQRNILKILHSSGLKVKKIDFTISKAVPKTKEVNFSSLPLETEQLQLDVFKKNRKTGLNPRYTFENFVVGGFNELAHAAATAVSREPGQLYNPLFLYGSVGLGKTHLLQAIGNEVSKNFSEKETRYIPAERLTSEIITSIRNGTIEKIKKDYHAADVLIIDDVQFLAGKEKTQEEFFHIFNSLYQKNKQIILSSDRPPKSIPALAQRLRSRFEGGMIADISLPDLETRIAILKTKAQEKDLDITQEICEFLANNIQTNIRELEGALNRILLYQKIRNQHLDIDKIKALVKEFTVSSQGKITPKKIIQIVAEFYDLKENDIISPSRKREIVRPRQVAMYLLRTKLQSSYPFIARKFGGKDHTTAIYACRRVTEELNENEELKKNIDLIKMRFMNI